MNLQKLVSILLIAIFSVSNVSAGVYCVNCVVKIKRSSTNDKDVTPFITEEKKSVESVSVEYSSDENSPDYILPLDDSSDIDNENGLNEEDEYANVINSNDEENTSIVLIDETQEDVDLNRSILSNQTVLYACEDIEHEKLVCDSVTKVCECV